VSRDALLKRLLKESHERQFNGEDYQKVTFDFYQEHDLTDDEMTALQTSPEPGCDCGFCAKAAWQD
jgi:hypothetical protein